MKAFTSCAVAITTLLSITSASPTSRAQLAARNPTYEPPTSVKVTLRGATPEASYCLDVPLNAPYGSLLSAPYDPNHLSISYVEYDHSVAICSFYGVDEHTAVAATVVEHEYQLGPPQTICAVFCTHAY
ncbi:hypothetical protein DL98DRAFT_514689 [Cadophora sp. DSE1049]|nr:hypothetical protein DL98DRAFT_514689 [Cadophora sp. DSE1049]